MRLELPPGLKTPQKETESSGADSVGIDPHVQQSGTCLVAFKGTTGGPARMEDPPYG